jgi:adenine-specific DNA methylase
MEGSIDMASGSLLPDMTDDANGKNGRKANGANSNGKAYEPPNLGKAIRLPVPDFNDPNRPLTCLEVDFPIAPINALSNLEGNAGKPVYQMSKWWARRRSSVFRSLLIAAATQAPDDRHEAAKRVWEHYYANHQKAGTFKKLRVLEPFMGGGTTMVEGARLGFQMTGIDLNPVAWFVTKNELACSDPKLVKALFDKIEAEVKPLVQPFYTTTCPRGHKGRWIDNQTDKPVKIDPLDLPPAERSRYRWEGPEVIYTFWAKHGPCQASGCNHRTPIFKSPIIAEKDLTRYYIESRCHACGTEFNVELGETRMAPGAERVVLNSEPAFTETTQSFANLLKQYDTGNSADKMARSQKLHELVKEERGLRCPHCGKYAGQAIEAVLNRHIKAQRSSEVKKKDFKLKRASVQMRLLVHPDWLKGAHGSDDEGNEYGGYAGAKAAKTIAWFKKRLGGLGVIEVRGSTLPEEITLADKTVVHTTLGTAPRQAQFTCSSCGRQQDVLDAVEGTGNTAPIAPYALQCFCPECLAQGYIYSGRYFKAPDAVDTERLAGAEEEWEKYRNQELSGFWPDREIQFSMRTHVKDPLPRHGYTHWWKMFDSRQLVVHAWLLKLLCELSPEQWPLDVREQALGTFQQYLRNQNMFAFYHVKRDCLAPFLGNANYNPKNRAIEVGVFCDGYGPWKSTAAGALEGLRWVQTPWEPVIHSENGDAVSYRQEMDDPLIPGSSLLLCESSTNVSQLQSRSTDLVITDPPFGDNVYYADLADFFYVWMRIPLLKWYEGMPERKYFEPQRTPHAVEAVDNSVEHPDDRPEWEKGPLVEAKHLEKIRELAGDGTIEVGAKNVLYRPVPSSEFYCSTLTACWAEAARVLKPGGLMAFTFHHSEDAPWVDVLTSLFNAGYILVATYPVRSDEMKGEGAEFGSKKIEYDIIHVCRKRQEAPQAVSWARMRRWVKDEALQLKTLLEHTHGKELPESDILVILRGKALEFYSRHYGQVFTGDGQLLSVGEALLGINLLFEDLLSGEGAAAQQRAPESAEPASRLFLRIFANRRSIPRDELHKTLRGTGIAQANLEEHGWIKVIGTTVNSVPIEERFQYFTAPGRKRVVLKTDLDQAQFLIGAATGGSSVDINRELNGGTWVLKRSVDSILTWYAQVDSSKKVREAAATAGELVSHWRAKPKVKPVEQRSLFERLEAEES